MIESWLSGALALPVTSIKTDPRAFRKAALVAGHQVLALYWRVLACGDLCRVVCVCVCVCGVWCVVCVPSSSESSGRLHMCGRSDAGCEFAMAWRRPVYSDALYRCLMLIHGAQTNMQTIAELRLSHCVRVLVCKLPLW